MLKIKRHLSLKKDKGIIITFVFLIFIRCENVPITSLEAVISHYQNYPEMSDVFSFEDFCYLSDYKEYMPYRLFEEKYEKNTGRIILEEEQKIPIMFYSKIKSVNGDFKTDEGSYQIKIDSMFGKENFDGEIYFKVFEKKNYLCWKNSIAISGPKYVYREDIDVESVTIKIKGEIFLKKIPNIDRPVKLYGGCEVPVVYPYAMKSRRHSNEVDSYKIVKDNVKISFTLFLIPKVSLNKINNIVKELKKVPPDGTKKELKEWASTTLMIIIVLFLLIAFSPK